MKALLTMLAAVLLFSGCMIALLFFLPHWPTVVWTVLLILAYVLQVRALYLAHLQSKD